MNTAIEKLDHFVEEHYDTLIHSTIGVFAVVSLVFIGFTLTKEVGFEPVWIARAVAEGQGFSFPVKLAWLCTPLCEGNTRPEDYLSSAWADPVFSLLYAGLISVFGEEWSRPIIRLIHLSLFCAAAFVTALTARRLAGPWAGLLALGFLLVATKHHASTINAAPIATLLISLIAYQLTFYADQMTLKRGAALGGLLGASALTWSSTMLFIPLASGLILFRGWFSRSAIGSAAVAALIAITIISPWTIRNYLVFDEIVPVRNGIGQVAWVGTVGAAGTFDFSVAQTDIVAPWNSNGPGEAVRGIIGRQGIYKLADLENWQEQILDAQIDVPAESLNEAMRDKWLFERAKNFVLEHPVKAFQLGFFKVHALITRVNFPVPYTQALSIAVAILSYIGLVVGTLLAIKRIELAGPVVMAAGFLAPFSVIVPYYYRYRQPIEPVIAILVSVSLVFLTQQAARYYQERRALAKQT